MQGAGLDRLVDLRDQRAVLGRGRLALAGRDGGLEATEVALDRRGVAAILKPLALGAQDPLLLRGDVGHVKRTAVGTARRRTIAALAASTPEARQGRAAP